MKLSVLLAFAVLAFATGAPVEDQNPRVNGENGWYVPNVDGTFNWVPIQAKSIESYAVFQRRPTIVDFYLYTRSNPEEPQGIEASHESIKESNFNKDHPTRFVIHGWQQDHHAELNILVRDAWLSKGEYNIIAVDWSSRSTSFNYFGSASYVSTVGEMVAELIDYLHSEFEMSFDSLTLIGHSLGAHVCGFAGKSVEKGTVHTIIGLDPALPLFDYNKPDERLSANDARYVESIHTNGGQLGFLKPIGKSAFYPNGGRFQPGCGFDITGVCSHSRSYKYYSEAVAKNTFPSIKCEDYNDALSKDCGATFSSVNMAAATNEYVAFGNYFVPVNNKEPFGKGV